MKVERQLQIQALSPAQRSGAVFAGQAGTFLEPMTASLGMETAYGRGYVEKILRSHEDRPVSAKLSVVEELSYCHELRTQLVGRVAVEFRRSL